MMVDDILVYHAWCIWKRVAKPPIKFNSYEKWWEPEGVVDALDADYLDRWPAMYIQEFDLPGYPRVIQIGNGKSIIYRWFYHCYL